MTEEKITLLENNGFSHDTHDKCWRVGIQKTDSNPVVVIADLTVIRMPYTELRMYIADLLNIPTENLK